MRLSDRYPKPEDPQGASAPGHSRMEAVTGDLDRRNTLKGRIHRRMIERLNLTGLEALDQETLRFQIRQIISSLINEESIPMSEVERAALEDEVLNETFGLGPIEPFLHDPDVSDIPPQHLVETVDGRFLQHYGIMQLHQLRKIRDHLRTVQRQAYRDFLFGHFFKRHCVQSMIRLRKV